METKVYTQYGTGIMGGVLIGLAAIVFALIIEDGPPKEGKIVFAIMGVVFLFVVLMHYKMSIYIDNRYLWFRMGIGLVSKVYEISDITDCRTVRLYNTGIKKIRYGWSYSVSGFKAVEFRFKDSNRVIRLGTKYPGEICDEINRIKAKTKEKSKYF